MATANLGTMTAAEYLPFFRYKNVATKAWTTSGNTDVVSDPKVSSNSFIDFMFLNGTFPAGTNWSVTLNPGVGFTVTSTDSESTNFSYAYRIL